MTSRCLNHTEPTFFGYVNSKEADPRPSPCRGASVRNLTYPEGITPAERRVGLDIVDALPWLICRPYPTLNGLRNVKTTP